MALVISQDRSSEIYYEWIYSRNLPTLFLKLAVHNNLPYVPGVGICEQRLHSCGKIMTIVHPVMTYRKKKLDPMENILKSTILHNTCDDVDKDADYVNPFVERLYKYRRRNKFYNAFLDGMPNITDHCAKGSEYIFEDGLRKVRLVNIL